MTENKEILEIEYNLYSIGNIEDKETFTINKKEWEAMSQYDREQLINDKINVLIDERIKGDYKIIE